VLGFQGRAARAGCSARKRQTERQACASARARCAAPSHTWPTCSAATCKRCHRWL
jgi:hypothetical protein